MISNQYLSSNLLPLLMYSEISQMWQLYNNQNLTDAHTCYKAVRSKIFKKIKLCETGFSFCPELTTKLSNLNVSITEVPIKYSGRTFSEGKKIRFSDGIIALITIIKYKFFYSIFFKFSNSSLTIISTSFLNVTLGFQFKYFFAFVIFPFT